MMMQRKNQYALHCQAFHNTIHFRDSHYCCAPTFFALWCIPKCADFCYRQITPHCVVATIVMSYIIACVQCSNPRIMHTCTGIKKEKAGLKIVTRIKKHLVRATYFWEKHDSQTVATSP